jgi:putative pyruvate formate lyase activating enzyme
VTISNAFPHFGEEPPLVGEYGSGTIFFSNCGLRCVYCQNYDISIEGHGVEISDERLAETMLKIQSFGCHNINLVTPTHYVPSIVNALNMAVPKGLNIPIVYNTSGYEKIETLRLLDDVVDIYLPDFKYMSPKHAGRYSSEAYNYPHYARLAFQEMHRQVGVLQVGNRSIARQGLMIRHLILPNRISDTKDVLRFISRKISKNSYVNLMRQYRPEYKAKEYPKISRRISNAEYKEALGWAQEFGLKRLAR